MHVSARVNGVQIPHHVDDPTASGDSNASITLIQITSAPVTASRVVACSR
jgi:hypothetical protein